MVIQVGLFLLCLEILVIFKISRISCNGISLGVLPSLSLFKSHLKMYIVGNENKFMPPQRTTPCKISVCVFFLL